MSNYFRLLLDNNFYQDYKLNINDFRYLLKDSLYMLYLTYNSISFFDFHLHLLYKTHLDKFYSNRHYIHILSQIYYHFYIHLYIYLYRLLFYNHQDNYLHNDMHYYYQNNTIYYILNNNYYYYLIFHIHLYTSCNYDLLPFLFHNMNHKIHNRVHIDNYRHFLYLNNIFQE